jgi:glyoxylase I family protein
VIDGGLQPPDVTDVLSGANMEPWKAWAAQSEEEIMPEWDKVSHISFSARDKAECAEWFGRVLGFTPLDEVEGDGWRAIVLIHVPSATIIEFQQHDANQGEKFDPRRTGLDHIGFKVGSRKVLQQWEEHFAALGIDYTPIADREYGSVLTFRDPDKRQFEMFYREGHP